MSTPSHHTSTAEAVPEIPGTVIQHFAGWFSAVKQRALKTTDLALAEARLAALSFAAMIFFAVLAAVSVLVAWGLGIAGLVYGLLQAGLPVWGVLTSLALLHGIVAVVLGLLGLRMSRQLNFAATRRQLQRS